LAQPELIQGVINESAAYIILPDLFKEVIHRR
jgi:hypothetical protein